MRVFEKAPRLQGAFEQITMIFSQESFLVAGGWLARMGLMASFETSENGEVMEMQRRQ